jgi:hypothetical protein
MSESIATESLNPKGRINTETIRLVIARLVVRYGSPCSTSSRPRLTTGSRTCRRTTCRTPRSSASSASGRRLASAGPACPRRGRTRRA